MSNNALMFASLAWSCC